MHKSMLARIIALVLALISAGSVWAHRSHGHGHRRAHVELFVGIPLAGSWHASRPYPHYYYGPPLIVPPVVAAVPPGPPVYIEQEGGPSSDRQAQTDFWWYYCPSQQAYYPYAKTCPEGWQRVAPQPDDLR